MNNYNSNKPLKSILKNNKKVFKNNKNKHISFSDDVQYKLIPNRYQLKNEQIFYNKYDKINNNYNNNIFCFNYFILIFIIFIIILYLLKKNNKKKNNIYNNLIL